MDRPGRVLNRLWAAHGSLSQAPHPPRRGPHGRRPAGRRAGLHELLRVEPGGPALAAAGQRRRRALLPAHRQGRGRLDREARQRDALPRARPQRPRLGARPLRGRGARPLPQRARGHRHGAQARRPVRGREGLARDEVPVEVHRQAGRSRAERHGPRRPGLPDPRPRDVRLRHRRLALRGAHRAARLGRLRPARGLRAGAADDARPSRSSSSPSCARTSTSTSSPRTRRPRRRPSTARRRRGPRRRARCCCGCGCCRCGRASCSSSCAGACATSRPTRPRCCSASAPSSPALLVFDGLAVRDRGAAPRPRAAGSTRCCATRA